MIERRISPVVIVRGPFHPPGKRGPVEHLPLTVERGDRIIWDPRGGLRFESSNRPWFQGQLMLLGSDAGGEVGASDAGSGLPMPLNGLPSVRAFVMAFLYGLARTVFENSRDDHAMWVVYG